MSKWNREYFQLTAGSQLVEIQAGRNRDPRYEINSAQHKQVIPFHEYVRLIYDAGQTNDYYMTANNSGGERSRAGGVYGRTWIAAGVLGA